MTAEPPARAGDGMPEEERARANLYALIARLFYDPDAALLAQICAEGARAQKPEPATAFEVAWHAMVGACQAALPDEVRHEHDTLFVGVGKSEVTPYTSHYVTHSAPDRHLVLLRERLHALGLGRGDGVFEVEDHVSGVCDVMRHLIQSAAPEPDQRVFFEQFVYPGARAMLAAASVAPSAKFYRHVAAFAQAFFEVEKAAFEMTGSPSVAGHEKSSR